MLRFSSRQIEGMEVGFVAHDLDRLAGAVISEVAAAGGARADEATARAAIDRFRALGFRGRAALFRLAAFELAFGPEFERLDPSGRLAADLSGPGAEEDRCERVSARLETLLAEPEEDRA